MDAGTKFSSSGNNNNLAWGKSGDGVDPSVVDGGRSNTVVRFRQVAGKGEQPTQLLPRILYAPRVNRVSEDRSYRQIAGRTQKGPWR